MNRQTAGIDANRLLENFFGLHIATIGQINIGFRHGINVIRRVELTGRIGHGRTGCRCFVVGVNALPAAGAEE